VPRSNLKVKVQCPHDDALTFADDDALTFADNQFIALIKSFLFVEAVRDQASPNLICPRVT